MPKMLVTRLERHPAEEYNVLWHNGKPLLSKQSVSARKCSRWDCLPAVSHRLLSCPQLMTIRRPALRKATPLRALIAQKSWCRRPPRATHDHAPALRPIQRHAAPLHLQQKRVVPSHLAPHLARRRGSPVRPMSKALSATAQRLPRKLSAVLHLVLNLSKLNLPSTAVSLKTANFSVVIRTLCLLQSTSRKARRWNMR